LSRGTYFLVHLVGEELGQRVQPLGTQQGYEVVVLEELLECGDGEQQARLADLRLLHHQLLPDGLLLERLEQCLG
jgi:hypothetical protein